jgi:hypothetical protein
MCHKPYAGLNAGNSVETLKRRMICRETRVASTTHNVANKIPTWGPAHLALGLGLLSAIARAILPWVTTVWLATYISIQFLWKPLFLLWAWHSTVIPTQITLALVLDPMADKHHDESMHAVGSMPVMKDVISLVTRLSVGQSGEKCKLLAGVARAPLAEQRPIYICTPTKNRHRHHRKVVAVAA